MEAAKLVLFSQLCLYVRKAVQGLYAVRLIGDRQSRG